MFGPIRCFRNVTLPALQKHFVNLFFVFAWEFCIEKRRGFLVNFFWSPFPTKRSAKTPRKNSGKIRSKIRGKIRDETLKKFGELSFCIFSDLTKCALLAFAISCFSPRSSLLFPVFFFYMYRAETKALRSSFCRG